MIWSINLPMTHTQFLFFLFFATRTILKYFENILELVLMFHNECESLVRENNGYDLETDGFLSRTFSPVVLSTQGIHYCVFLSFLRHEGRVCFLFPYLMSEAIGQCWTESDAKSMFNEWMSKERHYFLIECRKEKDFLFINFPFFFSVQLLSRFASFSLRKWFGLEWELWAPLGMSQLFAGRWHYL